MTHFNRRASAVVSLIFCGLFFAMLIVAGVFMSDIIKLFYSLKSNSLNQTLISEKFERIYVIVIAYMLVWVAAVSDIILSVLLRSIIKGEVFSEFNIARISIVSWGCIVGAVLFALLTPIFIISAVVAFIAFFVGICLRTVKNAFEEAMAIKEENDFTI